MHEQRILAINPGSTSTKIAVYQGSKSVFLKNIKHTAEDLKPFPKIIDQFAFRKDIILKECQILLKLYIMLLCIYTVIEVYR